MNWFGKISNNIESTMRLDNVLLHDHKQKCRCGNVVDLNEIADREIGSKLGIALKNIEEKLHWEKEWNSVSKKAIAGKILIDKFFEKQVKLWAQYQKNEVDWSSRAVSYSADAICPKCQTNLGKLTVTLTVVNAPEVIDLTKKQLIGLEASKEMLAYASKRMNFRNVEQLKAWRDNADAEQAKAVLEKAIADLNGLDISYEVSRITGKLASQIKEIDVEIRGRKVEWVNAVEKIVKERIRIIT